MGKCRSKECYKSGTLHHQPYSGCIGYGTDLMTVSHFGCIDIQLFVSFLAQYDACPQTGRHITAVTGIQFYNHNQFNFLPAFKRPFSIDRLRLDILMQYTIYYTTVGLGRYYRY